MDVNYNLQWFFENILSEEDAVKFLQQFNIIQNVKLCRKKHQMHIKNIKNSVSWVCQKKVCNTTLSVRKNTWLEGSVIPLKKIILLIYSWSQDYTSMKYCEKELEIAHCTAVDFNNYLREICTSSILATPGKCNTKETLFKKILCDISQYKLLKREIVAGADLKSLTSRVVRKQLEEKLSIDLLSRKKEIDELVMAEVDDQTNSHSEEEVVHTTRKKADSDSDTEDDDEKDDDPPKKKGGGRKAKAGAKKRKAQDDDDSDDEWSKKKPKKGSAAAGGTKGKKASAFTKSFKLSPELADVVGSDVMPRHEVVKKLWAVIKERELQDPKNKQFAICDDQLMKVFGIKRFRTFGMMKHLKDHFLEAA